MAWPPEKNCTPAHTRVHTTLYCMFWHMHFIWVTVSFASRWGKKRRSKVDSYCSTKQLKTDRRLRGEKNKARSLRLSIYTFRKSLASRAILRKVLKFEQHWFTGLYASPKNPPPRLQKLQRLHNETRQDVGTGREKDTVERLETQPGHAGSQASGDISLTPRPQFQTV